MWKRWSVIFPLTFRRLSFWSLHPGWNIEKKETWTTQFEISQTHTHTQVDTVQLHILSRHWQKQKHPGNVTLQPKTSWLQELHTLFGVLHDQMHNCVWFTHNFALLSLTYPPYPPLNGVNCMNTSCKEVRNNTLGACSGISSRYLRHLPLKVVIDKSRLASASSR